MKYLQMIPTDYNLCKYVCMPTIPDTEVKIHTQA